MDGDGPCQFVANKLTLPGLGNPRVANKLTSPGRVPPADHQFCMAVTEGSPSAKLHAQHLYSHWRALLIACT